MISFYLFFIFSNIYLAFFVRFQSRSLIKQERMKLQTSLVLLVIFVSQAWSQESVEIPQTDPARLFTVQIRYFSPPNVNAAVYGCVGTIITLRHVLTSAVCVNRNDVSYIAIHGRINFGWVIGDGSFENFDQINVHPEFNNQNQRAANIAVSRVSFSSLVLKFIQIKFIIFSYKTLSIRTCINRELWDKLLP